MSSTNLQKPGRGDIWLVSFDPTVGSEIRKTRPAVVVSSDALGRLPIKLVAPITDWKPYYAANLWHVRIDPDPRNGLTKPSAVDTLQIREEWIYSDSFTNSARSLPQPLKKLCSRSRQ